MSLELCAYQVFLSSPSGLEHEREAIRQTVLEVNEHEAMARGYLIIAVGWDREIKGWGNPQDRFSDKLRECDYTILVLADRWGSPTRSDGGGFSSGTEEEYEIARQCLLGSEPMRDILVLFKGIPEAQLVDPGPQLQKVLAFKEELEKSKSLVFATFDGEKELTSLIRMHLLRWLRDNETPLGRQTPRPRPPGPGGQGNAWARGQASISERVRRVSRLDQALLREREGDLRAAEAVFAELVSERPSDSAVLYHYARFLRHTGRFGHAIQVSKGLISKAEIDGEEAWEIQGWANLGISQRGNGQPVESEESLRTAIKKAKDEGDLAATLAYLENNLGLTLRRLGKTKEAEERYRSALGIFEGLEDISGQAHAHCNLSYVVRERGNSHGARSHVTTALELQPTSKRCEAMAYCNLGLIEEEEGEYEQAEQCFKRALEINGQLKDIAGQAMNLAHMARVRFVLGNSDGARIAAARALEINENAGNSEGTAMSLQVVAQIEAQGNDQLPVQQLLADARKIYESLGHRIGVAGTSADLAMLLVRAHRSHAARAAIDKARQAAEGVEHIKVQERIAEVEIEVQRIEAEVDEE